MRQEISSSQAAALVDQAVAEMARRAPALGEILAAFGPLKQGQAALRAGLPVLDQSLPTPDPARLAQGEPLAQAADLLACPGLDLPAFIQRAVLALRPALAGGFPALATDLAAVVAALEGQTLDAGASLGALLAGDQADFARLAAQAGVAAQALGFIMLQAAKPLLERRARWLAQRLPEGVWRHGHCPVCGSPPELAWLEGPGGQRWLRCSLCAHHWRFSRAACPACGCQDQDALGFLYAEGRLDERADFCRQCGKYVVSLDVRGLAEPPVWEVAALGLTHLDLLAQERGLKPVAWCAWNQFG